MQGSYTVWKRMTVIVFQVGLRKMQMFSPTPANFLVAFLFFFPSYMFSYVFFFCLLSVLLFIMFFLLTCPVPLLFYCFLNSVLSFLPCALPVFPSIYFHFDFLILVPYSLCFSFLPSLCPYFIVCFILCQCCEMIPALWCFRMFGNHSL